MEHDTTTGTLPGGRPPGAGPLRQRTAVLVMLVVLAVAAGVTLLQTRQGSAMSDEAGWSTSAPVTSTPLPTQPARSATAPDGGRLQIVEQGYTQRSFMAELTLTPGYGPGKPEPYAPVYTALMVRNTSTSYVALRASVTLQYLDTAGRPIVEYAARTSVKTVDAAVAPGRQVAVRDYLNIDSIKVGKLVARTVDAVWMTRRDAELLGWTEVDAGRPTVVPTGDPALSILSFTVHNHGEDPVTMIPFAVFRDTAGRNLGASQDRGSDDRLRFTPGDSQGSIILVGWRPPTADLARTEIYLIPAG